jgi:hypothetical protein
MGRKSGFAGGDDVRPIGLTALGLGLDVIVRVVITRYLLAAVLAATAIPCPDMVATELHTPGLLAVEFDVPDDGRHRNLEPSGSDDPVFVCSYDLDALIGLIGVELRHGIPPGNHSYGLIRGIQDKHLGFHDTAFRPGTHLARYVFGQTSYLDVCG